MSSEEGGNLSWSKNMFISLGNESNGNSLRDKTGDPMQGSE